MQVSAKLTNKTLLLMLLPSSFLSWPSSSFAFQTSSLLVLNELAYKHWPILRVNSNVFTWTCWNVEIPFLLFHITISEISFRFYSTFHSLNYRKRKNRFFLSHVYTEKYSHVILDFEGKFSSYFTNYFIFSKLWRWEIKFFVRRKVN